MNRLVLHGALADEFGGPYRWSVQSPREAIKALMVNKPGFEKRIRDMELKVIVAKPDSKAAIELDETEIQLVTQDCDFHIVPMPTGSKRGGIGKIVLGVALIAATVITGGAGVMFGSVLGLSGQTVALMGAGLVLSGVSTYLAPRPKGIEPNAQEKDISSAIFNGPVNSEAQGQCVPIVIGYFRGGTVVVATGISNVKMNVKTGTSYNVNDETVGHNNMSLALWHAAGISLP